MEVTDKKKNNRPASLERPKSNNKKGKEYISKQKHLTDVMKLTLCEGLNLKK